MDSSDTENNQSIKLIGSPEPFGITKRDIAFAEPGRTIRQIIDESDLRFEACSSLCVMLNGQEINPASYDAIRPAAGSVVNIIAAPEGGDNNKIVRSLLSVIVMYYSAGLVNYFGGVASLGGAFLAAGASMAGMYLIDQIAPIPTPDVADSGQEEDPQSFGIEGARNRANPWGVIPILLGKHRFAPPFAAQPYTEISGDDQYLRMLFCLGYGDMFIESMKIGETGIEDFNGDDTPGVLEHYVHQSFDPDVDTLQIVTDDVYEESLSIALNEVDGYTTRTTQLLCDEFIVDVQAPSGVFQVDPITGYKSVHTVAWEISYRVTGGGGAWSVGSAGSVLGSQNKTLPIPAQEYIYDNVGGGAWTDVRRNYIVIMRKATGGITYIDSDHNPPIGGAQFPQIPDTYYGLYKVSVDSQGVVSNLEDIRTADLPPRSTASDFAPSIATRTVTIAAGTLYYETVFISEVATPARKGVRLVMPTQDQYDVRVTRVTLDTDDDDTKIDSIVWTALRTITRTSPVGLAGLTLVEMRIKATDVLNGVVDTFNVVASTRVKDYTGSSAGWTDGVTSSNPASLFRHVLQCAANKNAVADDRLDLDQLEYWHEYCEANSFTYNKYNNARKSVFETLKSIASAGRASFSYADGKYSVVIDEAQSTIVQHFTPRNSSELSGDRKLLEWPHAFKVRFINADKGYISDERIVYDDGYTVANATVYEELQLEGITYSNLAYRHGRFHLAQLRLRPERYSFKVDIEHLTCTRGDLIRVSHDVLKWGLGYGRITAITEDSTGITHITLDAEVTMASGAYAVRVRQSGGGSVEAQVVLNVGDQTALELVTPLSDSADQVEVGDLFMFGVYESDSVELLIMSIIPADELSAMVTCIDYNPAVYTADTGTIPAFNSNVTEPAGLISPTISNVQSDEEVLIDIGGQLLPTMLVSFVGGSNRRYSDIDSIEAQIRLSGSADSTNPFSPLTPAPSEAMSYTITDVLMGSSYDIRFRYKYIVGNYGPWETTSHTVIGMSSNPSDVESFSADNINGQLTLKWTPVTDRDLSHYQIRYTPDVPASADSSGALISWGASAILVEQVPKGSSTVTVQGRAGTYSIKAVDFLGLTSINAKEVIMDLQNVQDEILVATISEDPAWDGVLTGMTEESNGTLILDTESNGDFVTEGSYEFDNQIDLGGVYAVRLQLTGTMYGSNEGDTVDTWTDLSLITDIGGANNDAWGMTAYYQSTYDDPSISAPDWSEWKVLTLGDVVGRGFQFKIIFTSSNVSVTPVVVELGAEGTMTKRLAEDNNVTSGAGAKAITFAEGFYDVPAISITADDMATGDYFVVASKSATGFTVTFKDSGGSAVSRVFDWIASGHGKVY